MNLIQIKLLNNGVDRAPAAQLSPLNEVSSAGNRLYLLSCWSKGPHRKQQTTQVVETSIGCSPPTDGKDLLLKIELTEHGEFEPLLT